jgi:LAO/AO transport system kinase
LGDDIQAIKAGILEIADLLVINKADRPGVENTERALRGMLQLAHPGPRRVMHHGKVENTLPTSSATEDVWQTPLLRTVATEGAGIADLHQEIEHHRSHLKQSGEWQRREQERLEVELNTLLHEALAIRWREKLPAERYQSVLQRVIRRELSLWQAVHTLLDGDVG